MIPDVGVSDGPIESGAASGVLNLVDPSSYLRPEPGRAWRFTVERRPAAARFTSYHAYDWSVPGWQRAAVLVSLLAMAVLIGCVARDLAALASRRGRLGERQ